MTKETQETLNSIRVSILELVKKYNQIQIDLELDTATETPHRIGLQDLYAHNPNSIKPSDAGYELELANHSYSYRFPDSTDTTVPDHGPFWQHSTQSC